VLTLREETPSDIAGIRQVNLAAFGQTLEADLVDRLRQSGALTHSLVAVEGGVIVAHLALSPVSITRDEQVVSALGLGPVAVHPDRQKRGIGTRLISHWLEHYADEKDNLVIVLGHADYYPRFGFEPAKNFGIAWEHDVPDDVFMVLELRPGALNDISGIVRYHPLFSDV